MQYNPSIKANYTKDDLPTIPSTCIMLLLNQIIAILDGDKNHESLVAFLQGQNNPLGQHALTFHWKQ